MVQFTKLFLSGFKSFVDATELLIEPGMTGIVGPNGCGKSNLVEALRWVMGESSARRLRGGEMEDVIFSGARGRSPRNVAEVRLTLGNIDSNILPRYGQVSELDVSRRIERAKGSTYRISGRETRARDVQMLFADAATGARSTSIVSQGQVARIIAAKPSDRRFLLETAAGIAGLYSRRHEAELRLKAAENNMDRLNDVITALGEQQSGLKKQARSAKRYRELSTAIRQLEAVGVVLRFANAVEKLQETRTKLQTQQKELAQKTTISSECARQSAALDEQLPFLRKQQAMAQARLQQLVVEGDRLEREKKRVSESIATADMRLEQFEKDKQAENLRLDDAKKTTDELAQQLENNNRELAGGKEAEQQARDKFDKADRKLAKAEAAFEQFSTALAAQQATKKGLEQNSRDLQARQNRTRERMAAAQAELEKAKAEMIDTARVDAAQNRLDELQASRMQAVKESEQAAANEADVRKKFEAKRTKVQQAQSVSQSLQAKFEALAAILAEQSSVTTGTGTPVSDGLIVPPGLEQAVAAALGEALLAPESQGRLDGGGRFWDTSLTPKASALAPVCDNVPSLAKVTQTSGVLFGALSQVGLVNSTKEGFLYAKTLATGQSLVDRKGNIWRWDGYVSLTDNEAQNKQQAAVRLEQQNRLTRIEAELATAQAAFVQAKTQLAEIQSQLEAATQAEKQARTQARNVAEQLAEAGNAHARIAERAAAMRSKADTLAQNVERHSIDMADIEKNRKQVDEQLAQMANQSRGENELAQQKTQLMTVRAEHTQARRTLDMITQERQQKSALTNRLKADISSWQARYRQARERFAEIGQRMAAIEAEKKRLQTLPGQIGEKISKNLTLMEKAEAESKAASEKCAHAEQQKAAAEQQAKAAAQAEMQARETTIRLEGQIDTIKLECSQVSSLSAERFNCRPEEICDEAGLTDAQIEQTIDASAELEKLMQRRNALGPVNLRAEKELNELNLQIEGMESEQKDLLAAIDRLRKAIGEINREGRMRLTASFKTVNAHFTELFTRLFGGGQAYLTLTEADDPLAAGLEIMASPPGKRLQTMSLLSGGEQALTAIALLFAVFMTNPTPVCILDEVDAPLDDANVDRFCMLLEELSAGKTRFLVITHHRMTMARMNRLYGVTMAERGVSRLVSVDLERASDIVGD